MSSSSTVSSLESAGFTNSDDELQLLEAKRQKLAEKWRKTDGVDENEGETKPVPKRKRPSSEGESEEEKKNEAPLQKKQKAAGKVGYLLRKYFRSIPSEERKRVHEAQQNSLVSSKKRKLAEDVRKDASADADEVFLPTVPSTSSDAGPSPTPSPTPSLTSLISLLSLTSLVSLSSTLSPPAATPRRGRPKKKVSTRARDALGRFLPDSTRVKPIVRRKRRTELEILLDYPD